MRQSFKTRCLIIAVSLCAFTFAACGDDDRDRRGTDTNNTGGTTNNTGGTTNNTGGTTNNTGGTTNNTGGTPGGNNTAPGPGFTSGVSGSKTIDALSESEVLQICDAGANYVRSRMSDEQLLHFICTFSGLYMEAFGAGSCTDMYDACVAEGLDDEEDECELEDVTDCQATVAEYEACTSARIDALVAVSATLTCSSDLQELAGQDEPAACTPLKDKCPALFE
jgi:hypothetical protein